MANVVDVSTELQAIMTAIYGEEVRGSIHDAIQKMANGVNNNVVLIDKTLTQENQAADAKTVGETALRTLGTLPANTNFNSMTSSGIYRLSSNGSYVNCPLENSKTGWLVVYAYGSSGISVTQQVFETGTSAQRTYSSYIRSANTTQNPNVWGSWQVSMLEVDNTLTQSGVPADAKTVGDRLLDVEFVPMDITNFFISNPTTAEVGQTIDTITFTYKINKVPVSLKLDGSDITPLAKEGTITKSGQSITIDRTYTLVAADSGSPSKQATSDSNSATLIFKDRIYWGAANQPDNVNSAFVRGFDSTSELVTGKAKTFTVTATGSQYIWFASPTKYGACNFSVGGFDGGFSSVGTVAVNNQYNANIQYYVYKSDNANLGTTTVIVS